MNPSESDNDASSLTCDIRASGACRAGRIVIAIATLLTTTVGVWIYWRSIMPNGVNVFQWLSLPLFTLLFGWIAFSFCTATVGWLVAIRGAIRDSSLMLANPDSRDKQSRCAVLMPIYNENAEDVFARVAAMADSLAVASAEDDFDIYILSDSTDPEVWLKEESCWSRLTEQVSLGVQVFYRHRSDNVGRKAGNIAEFCRRWGHDYEFMMVLDADSLVSGDTMVQLQHRMRGDPQLGILQVPPRPIGRRSLFARLQQFASQVYGPVFVSGFRCWAGDHGNYWGHNAMIRVEAFRQCCDLPVLPGKPPLGGHILSHDFVEAALMLRGGWKVGLADDLGGSYEECPTTVTDFAIRDQRWCQGNLQHTRLLVSQGFHPCSRLHFATGILSYVNSPLWILFLTLSLAGWIWDSGPSLPWSMSGNIHFTPAFCLFIASMAMLLVPKLYGAALTIRRGESEAFGGAIGLFASVAIETIASILLAPVMAVLHSRFVITTLIGKRIGWNAQCRDDVGVSWSQATGQYAGMMLLGLCVTLGIAYFAGPLLIWFTPLLAGWVLAIPLIVVMGSPAVGRWLRDAGLLLIPEERQPHRMQVMHHRLRVADGLFADPVKMHHGGQQMSLADSLFGQAISDPVFNLLHGRILQASQSCVPLDKSTRDQVRQTLIDSPQTIPPELRQAVLKDADFLKELHVTSHSSPRGKRPAATTVR